MISYRADIKKQSSHGTMVSRSEIIDDILTRLNKAEDRTLPFSFLLQTSVLSRRELLSLFSSLEQAGFVSHTSDFWGDPQSYTLLMSMEEIKCGCNVC